MMSEEESDCGGHRGDVDLTTDQEQVNQYCKYYSRYSMQ